MLEARGVTVRYGTRTVVDDVSLGLSPGEVLSIAGPNGAGKSTILAVLSCALMPQTGAVQLDGLDLSSLRPSQLALNRAVLEQTPVRDLPFSVRELIEMGIPAAISPARTREIAVDMVARLDLGHLVHQPVHNLSGGEAHRAHLARTLAQLRAGQDLGQGTYLLVDEPTASLDLTHQRDVLVAAREVAAEGVGVLVILHDLTSVAAISDRVILMSDGKIAAQGVPDQVLTPEILEPIYRTKLTTVRIDGQLAIVPRYRPAAKQADRSEGDNECLSP